MDLDGSSGDVAPLKKAAQPVTGVVWEHNSHIGDARATAMGARGEFNVGQLARQRYGGEVALIGFTCFDGQATAASDWGEPDERKRVRQAAPRQLRGPAPRDGVRL